MAIYNVGCCYRHGNGVKKDTIKAIEWYQKGADLGSVDCMVSLAFMYEYGKGIKKDLGKAIEFYKLAYQNGEQSAQFMLDRKKIKKFIKKNVKVWFQIYYNSIF